MGSEKVRRFMLEELKDNNWGLSMLELLSRQSLANNNKFRFFSKKNMTSFGDLREWGAIHLTRPFYIEVDGVGRHKEEEQWQTGKNRKLSQCHTLQDWRRTVDFGWRLSRVVTCCMSTEKMLTNRAWFDQSLVPGSPNRLDSVRDKWWRKAK